MSDTATADKTVEEKKGLTLLRASAVRDNVPQSMKVRTDFIERLDAAVLQILADAVVACKTMGRNTLKPEDVDSAVNLRLEQFKEVIRTSIRDY